MYFSELHLNDRLLDALDAMRFETCTPIQELSIPPLLEGKDLIGIAQTGTGKTAAYLLPILNRLCSENMATNVINCVIMVPTRELAQQIDQQLEAFSYFLPFSGLAVYGGNDAQRYGQEVKSMALGADILIATPGRLLSHLTLGNLDLSHLSIFVLDEADRMMDMGFIDDVNKVVSYLPKERQTVMFSATMPNEIKNLSKNILNNPISIEIAITKPADNIDQSAYICYEKQKIGIIKHIFRDKDIKRSIIFASKKVKVHELAAALRNKHFNVAEMHSDLDQQQRDEVMRNFKSNKVDIIVSTDLLSRGIDIDDIEIVINYDVPDNVENYVHRIGRTARANHYGKAITLVSVEDQKRFQIIEQALNKEVRKEELPKDLGEAPLYEMQKKHSKPFARRHSRPHRHGPSSSPRRRKDHKKTRQEN